MKEILAPISIIPNWQILNKEYNQPACRGQKQSLKICLKDKVPKVVAPAILKVINFINYSLDLLH